MGLCLVKIRGTLWQEKCEEGFLLTICQYSSQNAWCQRLGLFIFCRWQDSTKYFTSCYSLFRVNLFLCLFFSDQRILWSGSWQQQRKKRLKWWAIYPPPPSSAFSVFSDLSNQCKSAHYPLDLPLPLQSVPFPSIKLLTCNRHKLLFNHKFNFLLNPWSNNPFTLSYPHYLLPLTLTTL